VAPPQRQRNNHPFRRDSNYYVGVVWTSNESPADTFLEEERGLDAAFAGDGRLFVVSDIANCADDEAVSWGTEAGDEKEAEKNIAGACFLFGHCSTVRKWETG
jgi:hypothetical protein